MAVDDFFRLMFSLPSVEGILQWGFWDKARSTWNRMVRIKSYDTGSLAGERRIGERGRLWSERGWPGVSWPLPQVGMILDAIIMTSLSGISCLIQRQQFLLNLYRPVGWYNFASNWLVVSVVGSGILALNSNQYLMDRLPQGKRKIIIWLAYQKYAHHKVIEP